MKLKIYTKINHRVWSVGKTRAIYEYDDDQFDKEFIAREKQEALEKIAGQDASDQLSI